MSNIFNLTPGHTMPNSCQRTTSLVEKFIPPLVLKVLAAVCNSVTAVTAVAAERGKKSDINSQTCSSYALLSDVFLKKKSSPPLKKPGSARCQISLFCFL